MSSGDRIESKMGLTVGPEYGGPCCCGEAPLMFSAAWNKALPLVVVDVGVDVKRAFGTKALVVACNQEKTEKKNRKNQPKLTQRYL